MLPIEDFICNRYYIIAYMEQDVDYLHNLLFFTDLIVLMGVSKEEVEDI